MVKVSASWHLGGSFLWRTVETFSSALTFSSPFSFYLLVHNSLRNLVYRGTFFIASRRGMLTWTFQKVSKISFSFSSFLVFVKRLGNGRYGTTGGIGSLKIFFGGPILSIRVVASSLSTEASFYCFVSPLASLGLKGYLIKLLSALQNYSTNILLWIYHNLRGKFTRS